MSDDENPITESWWFEQSGLYTKCWLLDDIFFLYLTLQGVVQICAEGIESGARTYSMDLPHIKTRGDVMQLRRMLLGDK